MEEPTADEIEAEIEAVMNDDEPFGFASAEAVLGHPQFTEPDVVKTDELGRPVREMDDAERAEIAREHVEDFVPGGVSDGVVEAAAEALAVKMADR